mgnify:FL=1
MAATTDSQGARPGPMLWRLLVAATVALAMLAALALAFRLAHGNAARALTERLEISAQSRVQTLESVLAI